MAAAIMGDGAITSGGQEEHLVFEGVGAERPAVAEHDRLPLAPVVVINLGAVFRCEPGHCNLHLLSRRWVYVVDTILIGNCDVSPMLTMPRPEKSGRPAGRPQSRLCRRRGCSRRDRYLARKSVTSLMVAVGFSSMTQ